MAASATRYKLIFHAPLGAVEACKQAIFEAGAGHYPNYSQCAFTVVGDGQFLPGPAAQPHVGRPGVLETLKEAKVEAICVGEETTRKVVAALKK
ncbi:putative structural toxin protein [Diaporthe ampelina]|uniref:ATP phosphoribosyltransferase n=1 Tax=Diaporthe ampelina TaxID=1214573 RepID=A0A0G2FSY4_9PEZI|nr:putative structural toxin protein [Diaporthe ampelina]